MSDTPKRLKPSGLPQQNSDATWWYYESTSGIELYTDDGLVGTIPWRKLMASARRCGKIKEVRDV